MDSVKPKKRVHYCTTRARPQPGRRIFSHDTSLKSLHLVRACTGTHARARTRTRTRRIVSFACLDMSNEVRLGHELHHGPRHAVQRVFDLLDWHPPACNLRSLLRSLYHVLLPGVHVQDSDAVLRIFLRADRAGVGHARVGGGSLWSGRVHFPCPHQTLSL